MNPPDRIANAQGEQITLHELYSLVSNQYQARQPNRFALAQVNSTIQAALQKAIDSWVDMLADAWKSGTSKSGLIELLDEIALGTQPDCSEVEYAFSQFQESADCGPLGFPGWRYEMDVLDRKTGKVLMVETDYLSIESFWDEYPDGETNPVVRVFAYKHDIYVGATGEREPVACCCWDNVYDVILWDAINYVVEHGVTKSVVEHDYEGRVHYDTEDRALARAHKLGVDSEDLQQTWNRVQSRLGIDREKGVSAGLFRYPVQPPVFDP
ncbi:hypothetical protein [Ferrimicrobium acidiphilum]|uniref:Uncharacterized protein n=1 Tax=Ferrimicrobium acidiphilum TaxID=121039 RepID=A0ABV3Y7W8_9ACTN